MVSLRSAVGGLGLVVAAALVAPVHAGAASTGTASPDAAATVQSGSGDVGSPAGLVPVFDQGVAQHVRPEVASGVIADYWTPARRAAAVPADVPAPSRSRTVDARPLGKPRDLARPTVAQRVGSEVAFTHAEGKVFFRDPVDGRDKACSGGTINSAKKRLVLTAGHCVHGGRGGQWMQNWHFQPGYQFGQGPAGDFPAFQLWTKNAWINDSDNGYDYAIAITQTNRSGQKIVNRVGGNGLTVNPGRPFVTAIAYPVNFAGGEQQAFCQGTLSRRSLFNRDQQLNCDLRFGASGGPWLRDYQDSSRLGFAVSNQSYSLNRDGSGPEYGPYYDSAMTSLYTTAENASP